MKTGEKVAIGASVAAIIGVSVYYMATSFGHFGQYILQVSATDGGTVSPAPSPSGTFEPAGKVITVTATPATGYTVGQILLDGAPVTSSTFQVTMNMSHTIDVIFYKGGIPPVSSPVAIQALSTQTVVWGYYGAQVPAGNIASCGFKVGVSTCDQDWHYGNFVWNQQIQFKVLDANGLGVPAVKVQLYPSLFPDASKYQGYLILNGQMISQTNPIVLPTDSNGIVTVNAAYFYGLNDNLLQLCQDAGLYLWTNYLVVGVLPTKVYNGASFCGVVTNKGGHGITGQTPAMGAMQSNTIIAQILGTSISPAQTFCSCGFNVKML